MDANKAVEILCRNVYAETRDFYDRLQPKLSDSGFGFKILYGPPVVKAPVLFLGYQPGGSAEDSARDQVNRSHESWPAKLEYSVEEWRLAKIMRGMFDPAKLERCVGLNAIFFRAPSMKIWQRVPGEVREEVKDYCRPQVLRIIQAIQPSQVVCIGFKTMELFSNCTAQLVNESGRVLTKSGTIGDFSALATLHLSGARISGVDRQRIAEQILNCA